MTAALLFLGYAVVAGALAPALLAPAGLAPAGLARADPGPARLAPAGPRCGWISRAPRFGIGLWLALSVSWLAAVVLAILALTLPGPLNWSASRPGGAAMPGHAVTVAGGAGLLLAAAVLARAGGCVVRGLARARRERREHGAFLRAAGRPDPALGVVVLDQDVPAVYCLPGRAHRVVVTAGARAALDSGQLHAVLAHERAHLRGRHHLLVATASALGRAFPFVPLLGQAGPQVAALAEMAADDRATRCHRPEALAAALVALATAGSHAAALDSLPPSRALRWLREAGSSPPGHRNGAWGCVVPEARKPAPCGVRPGGCGATPPVVEGGHLAAGGPAAVAPASSGCSPRPAGRAGRSGSPGSPPVPPRSRFPPRSPASRCSPPPAAPSAGRRLSGSGAGRLLARAAVVWPSATLPPGAGQPPARARRCCED